MLSSVARKIKKKKKFKNFHKIKFSTAFLVFCDMFWTQGFILLFGYKIYREKNTKMEEKKIIL